MQVRWSSTLLALLVVSFSGAALPLLAQRGSARDDESAVRALVARYVDARERRDPAALGALFTADADQFTTGGEWRRGREAVVRGALASSERTGGTRQITVRGVRFPTPDVAIADGAYEIAGTRDGTTRRLWTTIVMTREPDGWRIAAIRNAAPSTIPK